MVLFKSGPSAKDKEAAERLVAEGQALFNAGDVQEALKKFDEALRIDPKNVRASLRQVDCRAILQKNVSKDKTAEKLIGEGLDGIRSTFRNYESTLKRLDGLLAGDSGNLAALQWKSFILFWCGYLKQGIGASDSAIHYYNQSVTAAVKIDKKYDFQWQIKLWVYSSFCTLPEGGDTQELAKAAQIALNSLASAQPLQNAKKDEAVESLVCEGRWGLTQVSKNYWNALKHFEPVIGTANAISPETRLSALKWKARILFLDGSLGQARGYRDKAIDDYFKAVETAYSISDKTSVFIWQLNVMAYSGMYGLEQGDDKKKRFKATQSVLSELKNLYRSKK